MPRSRDERVKVRRMSRVCVAIPTYNERDNISKLVPSLLQVFHENEIDGWILIIDDSSPDGTGEVADELSKEYSNVRVIHRRAKLGIGGAYKDAFTQALTDQGTDVIVEMDADLSHDPVYLPSLVRAAEFSRGVGLGSRYVEGGGIVGWSKTRRIVSWGANLLTRLILGLHVKDATSGYRAYARQVLANVGYVAAGTRAYAFQVEMIHRCTRQKYPIVEVPITFYERQLGKSKLTRRDILDFLKTVLRLRFWP